VTKRNVFWPLVAAAAGLAWAAPLAAQPHALTPDETAQGWALVFDGSTTSGWTIDGDVTVENGVLVIGGAKATRARVETLLGRNYEMRFEYRAEGGLPNVRVESSRLLGKGYVSTTLGRASRNEWIEAVFEGRYDPVKDVRTVTEKTRAPGEPIFDTRGVGGGTGDRVAKIGFEVPAGSKLFIRSAKVRTDAVDSLGVWLLLTAGLGIVILLAAVAFLRSKRKAPVPLTERKSPSEYPLWVRLGLWGLPNRACVWAFFWLSTACAVACGIYGLWDERFFLGLFLLVAAWLYWLTIRWVDRHGKWS
jgi:hypothetical protein